MSYSRILNSYISTDTDSHINLSLTIVCMYVMLQKGVFRSISYTDYLGGNIEYLVSVHNRISLRPSPLIHLKCNNDDPAA